MIQATDGITRSLSGVGVTGYRVIGFSAGFQGFPHRESDLAGFEEVSGMREDGIFREAGEDGDPAEGEAGGIGAEGLLDIAGPQEHHRKKSFQEESKAFVVRHRVDFDERYVWD